MLELITPNAAREAAFRAFAEEFRGTERFDRYALGGSSFQEYVAGLRRRAHRGEERTYAQTPEETFWFFQGGRMVGASRLRSDLNEDEMYYDGHVGFDVVPSFRRQGHGTAVLLCTCVVAQERGMSNLILTALESNVASCRTMERCGGVQLKTVPDRDGQPLCRYLICLASV